MVILIIVFITVNFVFYVTFCSTFEVLNVANEFYRYVFPTSLHFLVCFYPYILLYFTLHFAETLFFCHFLKRHLLTLLALNVAEHSSGSKTLASLRYTRSELLSLRSHRLRNRDVISAIKRF